MIAQFV